MKGVPRRHPDLSICLLLAAVTAGLYANVGRFDFTDFDDPDYATNPQLQYGLTAAGLKWAFTSGYAANWLPLTRVTHLADHELYGAAPGPPHVENAALHMLACLLLYAFLRSSTGSLWKSAFVAAVFAWHPLHVESVAWVSERKDVLCAVFWFLTLWLWTRYAARPGRFRYAWALMAFCLGLLSKPMIVTLPFVLLLIDFWPLRRKLTRNILFEKMPFFAIAAAGSAATYFVQGSAGAVGHVDQYPLGLRLENVLVSYTAYLLDTFWPRGLAAWYPYPKSIDWRLAALCGVLLAGMSSIAILRRNRWPWLATGWFWFAGTLVPVIGLVQVGQQSRADRYMYIPMSGLLIAVVWSAGRLAERRLYVGRIAAAAGIAICLTLLPVSWVQIQSWRNSATLFSHAAAVTKGNYLAWNNLASQDLESGRIDRAEREVREALHMRPEYPEALNNMGAVLGRRGQWREAVSYLQKAAWLSPSAEQAERNLGEAFIKTGRARDAREPLELAVFYNPTDADAHNLLGFVLAQIPGHMDDAISHLRTAIELKPSLASAHANLGNVLAVMPESKKEAISELQSALKLNPKDKTAAETLAKLAR